MQTFIAGFKKKYNGVEPDAFNAYAYDAMNMAAAVVKIGGTDRRAIRDAFTKVKDVSSVIFGKATFDVESRRVKGAMNAELVVRKGQDQVAAPTVVLAGFAAAPKAQHVNLMAQPWPGRALHEIAGSAQNADAGFNGGDGGHGGHGGGRGRHGRACLLPGCCWRERERSLQSDYLITLKGIQYLDGDCERCSGFVRGALGAGSHHGW